MLAAALLAAGCHLVVPTAAGVGALGASGWASDIANGVRIAVGAKPVLDDLAQIACSIQAGANAATPPNVKLSQEAGAFCKW
jgi:hypothetical protein